MGAVKASDTVVPCIPNNKIFTLGRHEQLVTLIWPACCNDLQSKTPSSVSTHLQQAATLLSALRSGPSKKRKVGEAIQEREKRQADAAAAKRQRQQAALAADAKKKHRAGSSLMGSALRSGLGSSSGLSMLGRFSKQTEEPTSPSRFRPTSPTAARGG